MVLLALGWGVRGHNFLGEVLCFRDGYGVLVPNDIGHLVFYERWAPPIGGDMGSRGHDSGEEGDYLGNLDVGGLEDLALVGQGISPPIGDTGPRGYDSGGEGDHLDNLDVGRLGDLAFFGPGMPPPIGDIGPRDHIPGPGWEVDNSGSLDVDILEDLDLVGQDMSSLYDTFGSNLGEGISVVHMENSLPAVFPPSPTIHQVGHVNSFGETFIGGYLPSDFYDELTLPTIEEALIRPSLDIRLRTYSGITDEMGNLISSPYRPIYYLRQAMPTIIEGVPELRFAMRVNRYRGAINRFGELLEGPYSPMHFFDASSLPTV